VRLGLAISFCLAVIVTWPLAIDPAGGLMGHPGNDVWNHVWGYWWVADEVAAGRFPLVTDLLGFPKVGRLFFIDTFGALLTLPVHWLAGPVVAYNAMVFLCACFAAFSAWLLCRHVATTRLGAGDAPAVFGAAAFTFSPHLLAQSYNGISETLSAGSVPFATYAALRFIERPGWQTSSLLGLAGGVGMLANWYYGLFAALGALILGLATATARWERVNWRRVPLTVTAAAVLAAGVVSPGLVAFSRSLEGEAAIVSRDPDFVWNSLESHNITDLVSVFRPGKVYSPDLKALHGEELLIVVYIGWALMLAAALGLRSMPRWRDRLPWLLWVGCFGLLMLGPYLYVNGSYFTVFDRRIPLPFLAFFDAFPLFDRISHPFRFVVPVQLGLAVLGTLGVAGLPRAGQAALGLAVAIESLALSPGPWPIARSQTAIPSYCAALRDDPVPGAVLDLPMGLPNLERAIYNYWQTVHQRPSPYSLNEPEPEVLARSHLARALRVAEAARVDTLPPVVGDLDLVVSGRHLADLGVRYVVMHERFYLQERKELTLALLRAALGPETDTTAEGEHIWRLERDR